MWSDNDIDNAFQRLNPPEPEPAPFPLDAWLRLETQLDKEAVARTVRRKMWRFFAAEVLIVALAGLGWLLWKPTGATTPVASPADVAETIRPEGQQRSASAATQPAAAAHSQGMARASALSTPALVAPAANAASETNAAAASTSPELASPTSRAAAFENRKGGATPRTPALALVPATPRRHSTLKHYAPTDHPDRPTLAASVAATSSRKVSRRARGTRSANSSSFSAQREPRAGLAPAGFIGADRLNRNARPRRQHEGLVSSATREAPAASALAAATDRTPENSRAEADNAELQPKLVSMPAAALALPAPLAQVAEAPPAVRKPEPRFFIGVVGAPDVSTVKFVSVEKPLLNLGLTLEYRFTNRLRLSTGLLRANKEYYARRADYDWTNYPRAQTRDFSWVEGKCTVLDVPLNLRYDALVRDNARWFGAAGLSSFFMHRENYSYDYLEGGSYKLWEMPGLVNANQHLFSVLNLSAGYERSLGQHWRLQAEPYVKVPLGGVGAGKVKLTSAGVFLGLKYGF